MLIHHRFRGWSFVIVGFWLGWLLSLVGLMRGRNRSGTEISPGVVFWMLPGHHVSRLEFHDEIG